MKKFIVIFIIFLLPNLFWQVVASFLDVYRVIFNLDYLFIISFWVLSKKRIGFFLFFVVNFFDFLNIFSQIFPFIRLLDLIYLIKFAVYANPINILAFILFLALSFFYIKFSAQKLDNSYQLSLVLCINFFLLFWFVQNFLVGDDSRLWSMQSNRVIASQILNTYNVRTEGFVQSLSDKGEVFQNNQIPSASNDIFKSPEQYKKMILIVNESWGIAKNDQFQKDLLAELIGNNQIQWLWRKPLNVDGFTINGEIRELCQKSLQGFNLKDQQTGFQNCLPNILKAKGYYTVAMHGATGAMYDRKYWYPKVGFDQQIFRESLPDLNSRCYSFPGFCDRDLQNQIVDQFGKHKKIFFYWLTLNTHVNYDLRDLKDDQFDCKKYQLDQSMSACRNLKLQKQFFINLSQLVKKPELKDTYVVIVGDHTPPIYDESRKAFEESQVESIGFYIK
ncbi:sulfatase-like hydrolase/transferase [Acinetobacter bereziniae]|uniref:sulfatase-like hydrolase/transferase n=1 Tax=Acinetobacter bereziniae TaxID=106648 RepID=UPI00124F8857|nr:sulfatase-like hydrolase/transferase [Acinetobacter bereziniae]MBJ9901253.1 sulfatase-like hydrolase/transferase [Acinetobacter bereziniae]MCU4319245.1 sulfatase-like hydrolase/transferase [Acinetobacter bereziniae]MCU4597343.1 sulfatase-like hydrolase/transferase [Acinetobacter bereziniae]